MKKRNNAFKRLFSLLLITAMIICSGTLSSCNKEVESSKDEEKQEREEFVEVLRVIDDIKIGGKFTNDKLEIVKLRADAVPEGAYSSVSELVGTFSRSHLTPGDIVTADKVTNTKPSIEEDEEEEDVIIEEIDPLELGYVVVTEYSEYADMGNFTPAIIKAMEENPGSTIYFPDGNYNVKDPIVISTDPAKSVSLRFSNNATLTSLYWEHEPTDAIIQIVDDTAEQADAAKNAEFFEAKPISITGGCLMASGKASGIMIDGGNSTYIYNVAIKSAYYGIHVKQGKNALGATFVNVDNVNITGYEAEESVGVLVEGTHNTFSNMRIASVNYGVLCTETGSNNIFRNLHPLVVGMNGRYTVGFWDKSDGNHFDVCYSDQFSAGFRVEEHTRALMIGGFCFWWTASNNYHVGIESTGKFNSIFAYTKVSHSHSVNTDAYLLLGAEGGQGVVLYPIKSNQSSKYNYMLEQHCKTPIS